MSANLTWVVITIADDGTVTDTEILGDRPKWTGEDIPRGVRQLVRAGYVNGGDTSPEFEIVGTAIICRHCGASLYSEATTDGERWVDTSWGEWKCYPHTPEAPFHEPVIVPSEERKAAEELIATGHMVEAQCSRCKESFVPAGADDLIHLAREDETECGGQGRVTGGWR